MALFGPFKKKKEQFTEEEEAQIKSLEQFRTEREKEGIVEFKEENALDKVKSFLQKLTTKKAAG